MCHNQKTGKEVGRDEMEVQGKATANQAKEEAWNGQRLFEWALKNTPREKKEEVGRDETEVQGKVTANQAKEDCITSKQLVSLNL